MSETLPVRVLRWIFASIIFSIIPLVIAFYTASPHVLSLKSPSIAVISSVKPSMYEVLSTGALYLVAASLAGGAVVAMIGTSGSWLWAKVIVGGTAACIVFFCASFYSNVLSSAIVDQGSVGLRSVALSIAAAITGLGAVLLAEAR
jgi:hypothetical protein